MHVSPLSSHQYGVGTASLNVAVAASIILHHFAHWAGYPERQREVRAALTRIVVCICCVPAPVAGAVCAVWHAGSGGKRSCPPAAAVPACEWCACSGSQAAVLHCLLSRARSLLWRSGRSAQGPAATCPSLRRRQRQRRRGERPQQPQRTQMQRLYQHCSSEALLCSFPSSDRQQLPMSGPTPSDTLQVVTPDRTAINPAVDPHQAISICLKLGASRTNARARQR